MKFKDTNPKEAVGTAKPPLSAVSIPVLAELGVAMMEGARKYGRHNYRVSGVRASTYFDALFRHAGKWWEGEDIDPDSGLSHITKAIATLFVLRDAMIQGQLNDDRPPKTPQGFFTDLEKACKAVIEKYPKCVPAFTEIGQQRVPVRVQCHGCGNVWDINEKSECQCRKVPDSEIKLDELPLAKKRMSCSRCRTSYNDGDRHACAPRPINMNLCPHCNKDPMFCDCL